MPKKKPKFKSTEIIFELPANCTVVVTFNRLGFPLSISANVLALADVGSLMIALRPKLSNIEATAVTAVLGFLAERLVVGWSSGINGAPSHSVVAKIKSKLNKIFCNFKYD